MWFLLFNEREGRRDQEEDVCNRERDISLDIPLKVDCNEELALCIRNF